VFGKVMLFYFAAPLLFVLYCSGFYKDIAATPQLKVRLANYLWFSAIITDESAIETLVNRSNIFKQSITLMILNSFK